MLIYIAHRMQSVIHRKQNPNIPRDAKYKIVFATPQGKTTKIHSNPPKRPPPRLRLMGRVNILRKGKQKNNNIPKKGHRLGFA